jgi:hypothetical protein
MVATGNVQTEYGVALPRVHAELNSKYMVIVVKMKNRTLEHIYLNDIKTVNQSLKFEDPAPLNGIDQIWRLFSSEIVFIPEARRIYQKC